MKKYIATEDTQQEIKDLVSGINDKMGSGGGGVCPHVTVDAPAGSTVTLTNGVSTLTAEEHFGLWDFDVPALGRWTATATSGENTTNSVIEITQVTLYRCTLRYVTIIGVCWNYGLQTSELARLTTKNDPNGFVNYDITEEPKAAVGTGEGSSPFDKIAPWSGMVEYNVVNGAIGPKKGEDGFSRSANDVVVKVPGYYYCVIDDPLYSKRYYYIADGPTDGFDLHPGSNKYVGRYETINSGGYFSRAGAAPIVNMTRNAARTSSKAKGEKWRQLDFATWCAIVLLYLVEYADWNSQAKIGRGRCDLTSNGSAINTGGTDSMTYHTGRADGVDGQVANQYRGVENFSGNVWKFTDGFNTKERRAYICTDPTKYKDDTSDGYVDTGVTMPTASNNFISKFAYVAVAPWAFIPEAVGGSESTYVTDACWTNTGWTILIVGGSWHDGSSAGVAAFYSNDASSYADAYIGARLLRDP